jgi:hypothetical protein
MGTVFCCCKWTEKLKMVACVTQEEGAGCPFTATNKDNIERACKMVFAYEINHNRLRFHKACATSLHTPPGF